MMKSSVLSELKKFLAVGMVAVCLDWGIYLALTNFFGVGAVPSKGLSYVIGTIFAFVANGRLVFQSDLAPVNFLRHLLLYTISLLANTLVFAFLKSNFSFDSPMILGAALLAATFVSTVINFMGMRFWVFKNKRSSHARS
jgi:putative flippase GtrA